jgi:hypothetical protein
MLKKLLTITLVLVGSLTLAGCTETDEGPTLQETLEMITEAVGELSISAEATDDLTLPNVAVHDVEVTWKSSNTDIIGDDGAVTRPLYSEGDKTVTMTAYLTLGGETLTKSFEVTVPAAEEPTDEERTSLAADSLLLPVSGIVTESFSLPSSGTYDTTVTWSTSNAEAVTADGTITRPEAGSGNASAILTATITYGDATSTKEFEVIVKEAVAVTVLTIEELKADISLDEPTIVQNDGVSLQGEVVSLFEEGTYKGFFISDGTGFIYVFYGTDNPPVEVGQNVSVDGLFAYFFGMPQVTDPAITILDDASFDVPAPVDKTVADILAYGTSEIDFVNYAELIKISGTVTAGDGYYYLETEDGRVELNDDSDISLLVELLGLKIEITAIYYSYHSSHGDHQIAFTGNEEDIEVLSLTDEESVAADAMPIVDSVVVNDITLPTEGPNGTTYSDWVSGDAAVFNDDGTLVARPDETVEVTFTGTVSKGDATGTATFTVTVPKNMTAAEVLDLEIGTDFEVTGVVYTESYYGFFIHSGGGLLFVYDDTFMDEIQPGDQVTILGYLGEYSGLLQANVISYTVDDSSGTNPLPDAVDTTVEGILSGAVPRGTLATVTGEITLEGSYNNVYIYGASGEKVEVYWRSNASELEGFEGQVITLTVVPYQNGNVLYQGVTEDVTVVNEDAATYTWSDADMAQALADQLSLTDFAEIDLDLPTGTDAYPDAFAWASDNAAIGTDGMITPVSGSETEVTLTVTVTVGTETATRDFVVTVVDADEAPMTVADALALYDGENTVDVYIYAVVSGFDKDGNAQLQDADGTGINLYDYNDTIDAEIGDLIAITGTIDAYYGNIQLEDFEVVRTFSNGNELVVQTVTAEDLATNGADYSGERVLVDLVLESYDDGYGYVVFTGNGDVNIVMNAEAWASFIDSFEIGDTIQVEANITQASYYGNVRLGAVELLTEVPSEE